jgi:Nucleotidyl transferase AbiEii toxin, Type IV TA system
VNPLERSLRSAASDLTQLGRSFAVVGGLAVSTWAEPRLTRDADLAVAVDDDSDAELLVAKLRERGYRVLAAVEQIATGRLGTVRLVGESGSGDGIVTDLLFASSGIEAEIVEHAISTMVVPGFVLPVACVGHLIAMKLLARDDRHRPADADDLAALAVVATEHDWGVAASSVGLIVDRGFGRGRDLHLAFRELHSNRPQ